MTLMTNFRTGCWVAALCLLSFLSGPVHADIDAGPYIQNVTQTSAQLLYEGDDADGNGLVEYGVSPALGSSVTASKRGVNRYYEFYLADLTGLTPNTLHYYRLTHEGGVRSGTFFTAPDSPDQPFTFAVVGDTRSNHGQHEAVVDALVHNEGYPDLFFNSGDLVASGEVKDQWQTFFGIESGNDGDILRNTVFGPSYGNHEAGEFFNPSYYNMYFSSSAIYAFEYGNAYFLVLNTESPLLGTQGDFIDASLLAARSNPEIDFIFVFFHKPGVTTSTSHRPHLDVLTGLMDKLEDANVDAVFTGHNHLYEHGVVNQVHHIVTGGGGAGNAGFIDPYTPIGWDIIHRESAYHYCWVSVNPGSYTVECKRVIDPETVADMDSYTAFESDGGIPGPTPQDLLDRATEISCGSFITNALGMRVKDVDASVAPQAAGRPRSQSLHVAVNGLLYGIPGLFIIGLRRKLRKGSRSRP